MRIFFDCEFHDDGRTIDLISIGLVRDDGRTLYRESAEYDKTRATPWIKDNVLPNLREDGSVKHRADIAEDIRAFAGKKPEFWAWYADYDWVCLCQLYGPMVDLPSGWPMYCRDVKQMCDELGDPPLTRRGGVKHNALHDAVDTKEFWDQLQKLITN